jgi:SAM-dependent methyltransferase
VTEEVIDQARIWEHFQSAASDAFAGAAPRYRFLASRIPKGASVLNVGVGQAGLEAMLLARGVAVHSLDPSESSIERARRELGLGDRARVGVSQAMPFDTAQFDVVVMSEVLEHLTDEALGSSIGEARRVLRAGGRLIGTVPANERLADRRTVCPDCGAVFHRWGHHQSFSPERIRALLEQHGFAAATLQVRAFPDWSRRQLRGLVKSAVLHVLGRAGSPIAFPHIYFVAMRQG